jgi:hypothetical protein
MPHGLYSFMKCDVLETLGGEGSKKAVSISHPDAQRLLSYEECFERVAELKNFCLRKRGQKRA